MTEDQSETQLKDLQMKYTCWSLWTAGQGSGTFVIREDLELLPGVTTHPGLWPHSAQHLSVFMQDNKGFKAPVQLQL